MKSVEHQQPDTTCSVSQLWETPTDSGLLLRPQVWLVAMKHRHGEAMVKQTQMF